MEKVIKEGQTQVYADGAIDRQFGINTDAPYLNMPPQQLIDIVGVLFAQSGKTKLDGKNGKVVESGPMSDSQVLAILVGMGTPQHLRESNTVDRMLRASTVIASPSTLTRLT